MSRGINTRVLSCDPTSIEFAEVGPDCTSPPTISSARTSEALEAAVQQLKAGKTVAFPTETVYGLGALALSDSAASLIFSTKGRPPDNPLIAHISSSSMLHTLVPPSFEVPTVYKALIKHFWPGPLTLLFPRAVGVPDVITAGLDTVAVRMPAHPVARALIAFTGAPLAAPSANASGRPSPTRASHVLGDLSGRLRIILDGGPCDVGLESTVVDGLTADNSLRILRPGGITVERISRVLREEMGEAGAATRVLVHRRDYEDAALEAAPTTPGMKYRHYAPSAPVTLLMTGAPPSGIEPTSLRTFTASLIPPPPPHKPVIIGILSLTDSLLTKLSCVTVGGIEWRHFDLGSAADPAVAASRLFDGLHTLDAQDVDCILVEALPEDGVGMAYMNRVQKAAGNVIWLKVDELIES